MDYNVVENVLKKSLQFVCIFYLFTQKNVYLTQLCVMHQDRR